ncbi:MAG: DUF302 domain-containing protein [Candidatus Thiodiazotropha sp. (ex Epidulcina cf. delphinae)]|nr:DUF302 domain-containing protein [Candidatus Thiodiazotropha sp. (ex Epidulcina cf. delphinae)]
MKLTIPLIALFLLPAATMLQAETGLINVASQFSVQETADRFAAAVEKAGLKIFSRIDHAAGAAEVEASLRPTRLIIFGSPKVGTALLTSDQRVGIDLPLKALAWRDAEGRVWLSYNSPDHLFGRFAINDRAPVKEKISGTLAKFSRAATQP